MAGADREPSPPWDAPANLPQGAKPFRRALVSECGISVLLERLEANFWAEHSHIHWQVVFLFGDASCTVHWRGPDGHVVNRELKGGEVWIIPPGIGHWLEWTEEDDVVVVYVHPLRVKHLDGLAGVSVGSLTDYVAAEPFVAELCQELRQFCGRPPGHSATRIANTGSLLAIVVMETQAALRSAGDSVVLGRAAQVVERVKLHVANSLRENLSVARLAKELGISPRHFRRLYRRATGMSPQEYLWSRRTARGKSLLASGNYNVTEAAAEAGFTDTSHMNRHFRVVYGVPPSAFLPRRCPP